MAKAKEATIFKGQTYLAGDELPDDIDKFPSKLGRPQRAAPPATNQGDRPGMSGSGQPQKADIVDAEGHMTAASLDDETKQKGSATKSKEK